MSEPILRRTMLQIGCFGSLGFGASLIRNPSKSVQASSSIKPIAKACILIWLDGGPSHLETWDPKDDVPDDVRGPFRSIATSIPGVRFSEHLSACARIADRLTVIRSLSSPLGEHGIANHYLLTGHPPSNQVDYPCLGSLTSHQRPTPGPLPAYITIPETRPSMGAGFLGATYEPFAMGGDPSLPNFQVRDLELFGDLTFDRLRRRKELLQRLNERNFESPNDALADANASNKSSAAENFEEAFRLIDSAEAKGAFQIGRESEATRAMYGPRSLGQSCLMARRMIEHGVRFVTVVNPGWDTHDNLVLSLRDGFAGAKVGVGLIPTLDLALSALITDLIDRGLLDETMVVVMGEFGRTPKWNTRGGRDHWPRVFSMALAGGGIPGGLVIGSSDRVGESPKERPLSPADLMKTLLLRLGLDPDLPLQGNGGRPIPILSGGHEIAELC